MADKHFVPRWRYQRVQVPPSTDVAFSFVWADPTVFSNTDPWPWHLHWLSMAGKPEMSIAPPFDDPTGGLGRRLALQAAISQWSTINLVPVSALAAMPHLRKPKFLAADSPSGLHFAFPQEVIFAPDGSIIAQVQNTSVEAASNFSLVLNGYRHRNDGSREPDQLSGIYPEELEPGASDTMSASDLYNDGETDFVAREMIILGGNDDASDVPTNAGTRCAWRINPATGIPWMPQAELIPEGCIAPFNRPFSLFDLGPRAYEFPKGTIMRRRQRLDLKVINLTDQQQVADLALFGMLEVS
jgi:hypothetical protein